MKTTSIDYPRGVTFEQVWAALQETDRIVKENARELKESKEEFDRQMEKSRRDFDQRMKETSERQKKFDRQMKESRKEFDQQMKETSERQKENDRQITKSREDFELNKNEFNKRFGEFTNRFGEVVEYMIAPNLLEKFNELGLNFLTVSNNFKVSDPKNNIYFEIDVKLDNYDKMMLVEIKTKLTAKDIKEHCKRLEKMRICDNSHGNKRALLGAVAGVVMTPFVKKFALEQGFYVIEPSGETFNITPPNGQPKEW